MKNIIFLIIICLCYMSSLAQLPDLNGYWDGTYTTHLGTSDNFNCAIYQDGNSVHGISVDTDDNFVFEGIIDQDTLRGEANSPANHIITLKFYESNDSVVFTYVNSESGSYGKGFIEKLSDCATLIVDFAYTGNLVNIDKDHVLNIDVYDTEDILETRPILTASYTSASGTAYIPGILTDPVYCLISCGYNERDLTFNDADIPYTLFGPDPGNLEFTPISIPSGNSESIVITFDDLFIYPLEALYPGGKMDYLGSYDLPFSPKYITHYNNLFYIISNINQVLMYSESFELQDTLEDNTGAPIFAHAIQFNTNGDYYTCDNTDINRYNSGNENIGNYSISSTEDADIEILSDMIYYSNRDEIIKLDNTLTSLSATLTKADIQSDYPPFSSQGFFIRDIAFDNSNRLAIAVDADPDEDGKDMLIYYDSSLDNYVDTIVGHWIMNNPVSVDFDDNNNCYIANYWHDVISVHDTDKALYSASYWLDEPGSVNGAMDGPAGHVVADNISYVVENNNNRVSKFKLSTGSEVENIKPEYIQKSKVYPVPFTDIANIICDLKKNERVSINVYNINGSLVDCIVSDKELNKGSHTFNWGNNQLKGIYCIVVNIGNQKNTHRVIKL